MKDKLCEIDVEDMELYVLTAIQVHKLLARVDLLGHIYNEFVYDSDDDQYFNKHINGLIVRLIEEVKIKELEFVFSANPDTIVSYLAPLGTVTID
jgi:hypothetical protein